jgi:short-subunit dehydrogenase
VRPNGRASPLPAAPHALITGASGAIGGALARALRRRWPGTKLSLVDRDPAAATALAAALRGPVHVATADLTRLAELPALVAELEAVHGPVDLLASCAGVMDVGSVAGGPDWDRVERLLVLDLLAPLRLQHLLAPAMSVRGQGAIVNVSSMAGRVPLKGCAHYGAAKAGLAMASEVARAELAPRGVHVLTVYPGPVVSNLEKGARAGYPEGALSRALPTGDAAELAERIVAAIEAREPRLIYPSAYSLGYRAAGLAGAFALAYGPDPRS